MTNSAGARSAVVVAIDLHKGSNLIMSRALAQAASMDADVHVICVTEPNIANVKPPEDLDMSDLTGGGAGKIEAFATSRVADFKKKNPTLKAPTVRHYTETGDAAEKIVNLATRVNADMVILGTHGRTGIKRLLIGSVAEKVVRLAGCEVLVVREKKHEQGS
ncbi:MAG: universal stress protein [Polyangiaceae bacterium]|nr:universal stress protein [Polyangiaceae bacterium]